MSERIKNAFFIFFLLKSKSATAGAAKQKTQTPIVAKQFAQTGQVCNCRIRMELAFLSNSTANTTRKTSPPLLGSATVCVYTNCLVDS